MRRALLSAFGIAALALANPGAALARHHHHHHAKAKAHHARAHFLHVGANGVTPQRGPGVGGPGNTKASSEPPVAPSEGAGKIASFTEGVLTIALNDGSTVSGKVTSGTEIKCEKAAATPQSTEGEKDAEDGGTSDEDANNEGDDKSGEEGDDKGSGDDGSLEGAPEPPCDTSALTPGTVVREAELRVSSTEGAVFESIELVR
jgi:hypothetical protein